MPDLTKALRGRKKKKSGECVNLNKKKGEGADLPHSELISH